MIPSKLHLSCLHCHLWHFHIPFHTTYEILGKFITYINASMAITHISDLANSLSASPSITGARYERPSACRCGGGCRQAGWPESRPAPAGRKCVLRPKWRNIMAYSLKHLILVHGIGDQKSTKMLLFFQNQHQMMQIVFSSIMLPC